MNDTVMVTVLLTWSIPVEERYGDVILAACLCEPEPDSLGVREADAWLGTDAGCEILFFSGSKDGSFSDLDVEDQRWYMLLAAEALYGPNRDYETLRQAVIEANPEL